jgi:hypothetical protein
MATDIRQAAAQRRARREAERLATRYLEASELADRKAAEAAAVRALADEDLDDIAEEREAEARRAAGAAEALEGELATALAGLGADPGVALRRGGREVLLGLDEDDDLVVDFDDDV